MDNKYSTHKLKNGMRILFIPMEKIELMYVQLVVNVGVDDEDVKKNLEAAHFLEHIFSTYTSKKYPDAKKVSEIFSQKGIEFNDATVNNNTSKYDLKFHKKHLDLVFDVLVNCYTNFKIDLNILEQERNSIRDEINENLDDQWIELYEMIDKELYPNHNRGLSQKVNLKSVKKMSSKTLIDFYKKYYIPFNTTLILAGDFDEKECLKKIKKLFGSIPAKQCLPYNPNKNLDISKINLGPRVLFNKKTDTNAYNLFIIFRVNGIYFGDEYFYHYTLSSLCANSLESLFYKRLRTTEGLIYNIDYEVNLDENYPNLSNIMINTTLDEKNILKTIKIILEIFNKLKTKLINDVDFKKTKNDLEMAILKDKISNDPEEFINIYGRNLIFNYHIETAKSVYDRLFKITKQDIMEGAKKTFLKENLIIAYSGKKDLVDKINNIIELSHF